jgi:sortase A
MRLTGRTVYLVLLSLAVSSAARAFWIPFKAQLAQLLLGRAWAEVVGGKEDAKPWPWADTRPIARLRVPRLGVDEYVLAGASGRTLAFGPGHVDGTAAPGASGNSVLSGHRDTHFSFLERLRPGDELELTPADGHPRYFRVVAHRVVDRTDTSVLADTGVNTLTLVTCYPFDAIAPGGPLRFVVQAEELDALDPPAGLPPPPRTAPAARRRTSAPRWYTLTAARVPAGRSAMLNS